MRKNLFSIGKLNVTVFKLAVILLALTLLTVGAVYGINAYSAYIREQRISEGVNYTDSLYNKFENAQIRDEKLSILADTVALSRGYIDGATDDEVLTATYDEVAVNYESVIEQMKGWFSADYSTSVSEAVVDEKTALAISKDIEDNVDNNFELISKNYDRDIEILSQAVENLTEIITRIESESEIVGSDNDELGTAQSYINKYNEMAEALNVTKKAYDEKLEEEAESKKAKSGLNSSAESSGGSGYSYSADSYGTGSGGSSAESSSDGVSSSSSDGSASWDTVYWHSWDDTGETFDFYTNEGGIYDMDGNELFSREEINEWGMGW